MEKTDNVQDAYVRRMVLIDACAILFHSCYEVVDIRIVKFILKSGGNGVYVKVIGIHFKSIKLGLCFMYVKQVENFPFEKSTNVFEIFSKQVETR